MEDGASDTTGGFRGPPESKAGPDGEVAFTGGLLSGEPAGAAAAAEETGRAEPSEPCVR